MNKICFECGSNDNIHLHHVVPKSKGGTKTIPLCELCHSKVHGEHMLKIQKLAWIGRRKKRSERLEKGLPDNTGRPVGTKENLDKFLNKPKNKIILKYLEEGLTIRKIGELTGCSNKTIIKVKKLNFQYIYFKQNL
jgi:hypothetical protein